MLFSISLDFQQVIIPLLDETVVEAIKKLPLSQKT
jgi:hypothetical protein